MPIASGYEVLIKLKEAAEMLHICPDSLYNLVNKGEIPSFKIGNQWRFRIDLLESWIGEQTGPKNLHEPPARTKPRSRRVGPKAKKRGKLSMKHTGPG